MSLFGSLLRGTDWSQVTEYLSPVFFQIVPPLAMAGQLSTLAADFVNAPKFARLCTELGPRLTQAGLPPPAPSFTGHAAAPPALSAASAKARGELLLKLYFWQLLNTTTVILNLRAAAFSDSASGANTAPPRWHPHPLLITYEPAFAQEPAL